MEIRTFPQPRLRNDLAFSRRETPDGPVFVVKDPETGSFYRFREAEHFILEQLDGDTSAEVIRRKTEERFQASLSVEGLAAFIRELERSGLLESNTPRKSRKAAEQKIVRGSLLYLRFKALDPGRLFAFLQPRVRFLFTRYFVIFSALLIVLAGAVTIANWSDFLSDLSHLYRLSSIPVIMVTVFLVICAHEFAHGLTCRYFGGEVREIGFLLIYFQPAFYCNVSDAWLFPEKSKRLWVGFAGPYFEMFLLATAVVGWRLFDVDTWLGTVALIVMATSGIKTVLNLNPLLKLDGYYLLSDLLEIPNLRRRSFRYVGDLIRKVAGGQPSTQAEDSSWRDRMIYLIYGVLGSGGSFLILAYVVTSAGGYFVEGRQPTAALLVASLLVLKLRRRFRRLFGKGGAVDLDDLDDFGPSPQSALVESARQEVVPRDTTTPVPAKPRKRTRHSRKRPTRWIAWIAVAALTFLALFLVQVQLRVSGAFSVLPRENTDVRAPVDGVIERVFVNEGDSVTAGDPVARLSDRIQRAELEKTESDLEAKRARLRMLQAGSTREAIELAKRALDTGKTKHQEALNLLSQAQRTRGERLVLAESEIHKAAERLQFAEKNSAMFELLVERGLGARSQLDAAAEQLALRRRELEQAQTQKGLLLAEDLAEFGKDVAVTDKEAQEAEGNLQLLLAGTRKEEVDALLAEIRRSEADRAFLLEQIEGAHVSAAASGVVVTPSPVLKELNGQAVKRGDLIAKIHDFKVVTAQIVISEKEIAEVRVGQKVTLRARAYPTETFDGTVTAIAPTAQGGPNTSESLNSVPSGGRTIVVTTEIDNQRGLLKPQMTGQAKVFCGPRRVVDLVSRRIARTFRVEVWSWF